MKFILKPLLLLVIVLLACSIFFWDGTPPEMVWEPPEALGAKASVGLEFLDSGRGLRTIEVRIRQGDADHLLYQQNYAAVWLPWKRGPGAQSWTLEGTRLKELGVEQGPVTLVVSAEDQANLGLSSRRMEVSTELEYDTTPPRLWAISRQHYIRQGGSEAVLYRVSEPAVSGVTVGDREFPGFPIQGHPEGTHIALFALPWDGAEDTPIQLWAQDHAGNRTKSGFWVRIQQGRYRERTIEVSDSFVNAVAPEILANSEIEEGASPRETFVAINSRLREINNDSITKLTEESAPAILWEAPFLQLSNSQVEAHFADQRSYRYGGEVIDRQTHLGFDLASTAHSPIEASNAGRVAWADYLGIYGNCLLIDHGLGLYSLYGHLSSFEVAAGDLVTRGQTVGYSGETGLAAGDHLHFSMVLGSVQVNPMEWWDATWVENHLLSKLVPEEEPES